MGVTDKLREVYPFLTKKKSDESKESVAESGWGRKWHILDSKGVVGFSLGGEIAMAILILNKRRLFYRVSVR